MTHVYAYESPSSFNPFFPIAKRYFPSPFPPGIPSGGQLYYKGNCVYALRYPKTERILLAEPPQHPGILIVIAWIPAGTAHKEYERVLVGAKKSYGRLADVEVPGDSRFVVLGGKAEGGVKSWEELVMMGKGAAAEARKAECARENAGKRKGGRKGNARSSGGGMGAM